MGETKPCPNPECDCGEVYNEEIAKANPDDSWAPLVLCPTCLGVGSIKVDDNEVD